MDSIADNLDRIRQRIHDACDACGRSPGEVTLVAVSKTVDVERIRAAYDAGHRDFGESRLQEAIPKIEALPKDIQWHFIGKLQSNKARKAASLFRILHTLESTEQLKEIEKGAYPVDAFIEVNIAKEERKSGIFPGDVDDFRKLVLQCRNIRLRGLMTVGPAMQNAELMHPYFRRLRDLAGGWSGGSWLSMGMSGDFEVAIQEGASHIRVGSAIFGSRG